MLDTAQVLRLFVIRQEIGMSSLRPKATAQLIASEEYIDMELTPSGRKQLNMLSKKSKAVLGIMCNQIKAIYAMQEIFVKVTDCMYDSTINDAIITGEVGLKTIEYFEPFEILASEVYAIGTASFDKDDTRTDTPQDMLWITSNIGTIFQNAIEDYNLQMLEDVLHHTFNAYASVVLNHKLDDFLVRRKYFQKVMEYDTDDARIEGIHPDKWGLRKVFAVLSQSEEKKEASSKSKAQSLMDRLRGNTGSATE